MNILRNELNAFCQEEYAVTQSPFYTHVMMMANQDSSFRISLGNIERYLERKSGDFEPGSMHLTHITRIQDYVQTIRERM